MQTSQRTWKRSSATGSRAILRLGIDRLGLILDTSILIASERRGESIRDIFSQAWALHGDLEIAISAVSVVELMHGIFRARTEVDRVRRRLFAGRAFHDLVVYPLSFEIAQLAGRIEGEQAAQGISIAFEDLIIGATALHLGFDVATLNLRHFEHIPDLKVVSL
jgi:predicted nucleic acid-binding protein